MSIDIKITPQVYEPQPIKELQEAIVALEKEAEGTSPDQHDQFLTTVKRQAGVILQILDRMVAQGLLPFNYMAPVRMAFGELRNIGEELTQATKLHHQQFANEQSALDKYKNFKFAVSDVHVVKEFQVPTFESLIKKSPLASAVIRLIRTGSEVAKAALNTLNSSAHVETKKAKVRENAIKVAKSPAVYRCFNKDGDYVTSIPAQKIPQHKDIYFHATGPDKAIQILSSGKIKRVDLGAFRGAFVSSKPELGYGPVVFALNRSIETIPVLNARFDSVPNSHWVGFASSIPVNLDSLEYVAVDLEKFPKEAIPEFKAKLSQAAGREIQVKPVENVMETLEKRLVHENVCVPEEWPLKFEDVADTDWL